MSDPVTSYLAEAARTRRKIRIAYRDGAAREIVPALLKEGYLTALDVAAGFEKTFSVGGLEILEKDAPPRAVVAGPPPTAARAPRTERRTSVTKLQRETAAAVELIALCQNITADGVLDEREVGELRTWLAAHKKTKLPACSFLLGTAERIIRDGRVTAEERDELYRAIETAIPVDVRATMKAARMSRDPSVDEEVRRARSERKRDEPVGYTEFFAKGVEDPECVRVNTSRTSEGDRVFLRLEGKAPDGTEVWAVCLEDGKKVGNIPGDGDYFLHRQQSGELVEARVKRVFTGGRHPVPIIYVNFFRPDADVDPAIRERPTVTAKPPSSPRLPTTVVPAPRPAPLRAVAGQRARNTPPKNAGCAIALAVLIGAIIGACALR